MLKDNHLETYYIPKEYRDKLDIIKRWKQCKNRTDAIKTLIDIGTLFKHYVDKGEKIYVKRNGEYMLIAVNK